MFKLFRVCLSPWVVKYYIDFLYTSSKVLRQNDRRADVGRYGKFNIGIWYDSNITVYRYMHAATSRLPGRSLASFCVVLVLAALAVCLLYLYRSRWGWWTFRCESRFDVLHLSLILIFCTTNRSRHPGPSVFLSCLPRTQNISTPPVSYPLISKPGHRYR